MDTIVDKPDPDEEPEALSAEGKHPDDGGDPVYEEEEPDVSGAPLSESIDEDISDAELADLVQES